MRPAQPETDPRDDPAPAPDHDDAFAASLAAWDQAVADGKTDHSSLADTPRLRQAQAFLQQVESLWPRRPEPLPAPAAAPLGKLGRLNLQRVLGMGGFAVVYLAEDTALGRAVAVKLPLPELLFTPRVRERFLREARVVAQLHHPNILPIFDIGEMVSSCYLVTAYCAGGSLADWLRQRTAPVSPRLAAAIMAQLADAVQYAHERGILHRDLKPSNILLERAEPARGMEDFGWSPRVSDFGLAKTFQDDASGARIGQEVTLTATAALLGTPLYMAPEQAQGHHERVCPATDVHALGVILYELLAGEPPFRAGTQLETLRRVVDDEPTPLRRLRGDVPSDLAAVCEKCLQKAPEKRYGSARELMEDLRRFLAGVPTRARPTPVLERAVKWARRHPARAGLWTLAIAAFATLIAGISGHLYRMQEYVEALEASALREKNKADEADRLRRLAADEAEAAAQLAYATNIKVAGNFWKTNQFGLAGEFLNRQLPAPDGKDRRGFDWYWLAHASRSMRFLRGHDDEINAVAFQGNCQQCISTSADATLKTWDVATGTLRTSAAEFAPQRGHRQFSATGRRLLVALPEALEVWDTAPPRRIATRPRVWLPDPVLPCLNASGDAVAFADGAKKCVFVWRLADNDVREIPACKFKDILALAFAPDGCSLAVAGTGSSDREGVIDLWDLTTNRSRGRLRSETGGICKLHWAGRFLASADFNKLVHIWDVDRLALSHSLPACRDRINDIRISPTGKAVAVVELFTPLHTTLSRVTWWDASGQETVTKTLEPGCGVYGLDFAPSGRTLALGCADGLIRLWAPHHQNAGEAAQKLFGHWPLPAWGLAFAPHEPLLASGGDGGFAYLWDLKTAKKRTLWGHSALVTSVAFSPDGQWLATGGYDRRLLVWDVARAKVQTTVSLEPDRARCVVFAPDGQSVACAGYEKCVRIFDLAGQELAQFPGHQQLVRGLAFAPTAPLLASASEDHTVRLWDVVEKKLAHQFTLSNQAWCVAFSPDGKTLAMGTSDGGIYFWDVATRQRRAVVRRHLEGIRSIAFSPDGRCLASAAQNGAVRLWHVATLEELVELAAQGPEIHQIVFSPDGTRLAAAKQDGSLAVWFAPRAGAHP
jgi:WD40 repeat protein